MTKRGSLHWEESDLQRYAANRGRWTTAGNAIPVELQQTATGKTIAATVSATPAGKHRTPTTHRSDATRPYFALLMGLLRPHGIPQPRCEFRFDEIRQWRFDFAWVGPKIAVEIDGGLFVSGSHNRGAYLLEQMAKQNAAVLLGWRILRYAPHQLTMAARDVVALMGGK